MILNQGLISEKKQYINISVFNFKKTSPDHLRPFDIKHEKNRYTTDHLLQNVKIE